MCWDAATLYCAGVFALADSLVRGKTTRKESVDMTQVSEGPSPALATLLDALVSLADADAAYALMQDLCTPRELEDLAQRLEVARMLDAGVVYARIQAATGASATTVARVARCLKYGTGGYRSVLDVLPPYREPGHGTAD